MQEILQSLLIAQVVRFVSLKTDVICITVITKLLKLPICQFSRALIVYTPQIVNLERSDVADGCEKC